MKENLLQQIIKNDQEVVVLSDSKDFVNNLDKLVNKKVDIILVDNVFDLISFEAYIFREDIENIVLVNDVYEKKEFVTSLTRNLLKIFEKRNQFKPIILYPKNDYKYKSNLIKISELCPLDNIESTIEFKTENILYIGQYGTCGYASASKGYIVDYILKNKNICWKALKFDDSELDDNYYVDVLAKSVLNKLYPYYDLAIFHCVPELWQNFKQKYAGNVKKIKGYCTWETNKLPNEWVKQINCLDEIMVPSNFNKETFTNSGVKSKIEVVPHVWFPQNLPNKEDIRLVDYFGNVIPKNKYTYYCIAELNSRKGILDLISVFNQIYENNKNCQLVLKLHYKNYEIKNIDYCIKQIFNKTKYLNKSIFLILKNINNRELLALHSFGDCYVSLNKGEGFGLTIFEAFNYNKKVITTGFGGPLDYLPKNYGGLVKYKMVPVTNMENFSKSYTSDQMWAQPDLEHAKHLMTI